MKTIPGYFNDRPGIQVATKLTGPVTRDDNGEIHLDPDGVRLLKQLGVTWTMVIERQVPEHSAECYTAIREALEKEGLKLYRIENASVHNCDSITLGLEDRDEKIEEFLRFIRNLGAAGIRYNTYAHMANGIWRNIEENPVSRDLPANTLNLKQPNSGWWKEKRFFGPLSHGREYSEDELWENYEYFIKKVVPVAEEADVYIGIHPDDPPVYSMGGIPRCIFGTADGYRRALSIADSDHIGACLCTGCWLEGGSAMGCTPLEMMEELLDQKKLFKVHVRNVTQPIETEGGFSECTPYSGCEDLTKEIELLHRKGYDGAIINDHLTDMVGGYYTSEAAFTAYIKGLVDAVQSRG